MAFLIWPEGPDLKISPSQLAVLETGKSPCLVRPMKKARVIIKAVTKHQIYVEQDDERFLLRS
jgi:hypothetical protein